MAAVQLDFDFIMIAGPSHLRFWWEELHDEASAAPGGWADNIAWKNVLQWPLWGV